MTTETETEPAERRARGGLAVWLLKRAASFGYAFAGLAHLVRTQPNAQIHLALAAAAVALGLALGIGHGDWLALTIVMTLVIAAEGVNTSIEAAVDLASPQRHPLAKVAKDVGAATVLVTAIGAVIVGMIIFLPRLWALAAPLLGL